MPFKNLKAMLDNLDYDSIKDLTITVEIINGISRYKQSRLLNRNDWRHKDIPLKQQAETVYDAIVSDYEYNRFTSYNNCHVIYSVEISSI